MGVLKLTEFAMNFNSQAMKDLLKKNLEKTVPLGQTDEFYRALVPKGLGQNLRFRQAVLGLGYSDPEYARQLWIISARDPLFFINTFAWTLNPKEYADQPLRPFITYGYQDKAILDLADCIGKEDVAVPKTRDMGATWVCLLVMDHRWRFRPMQQFLLTSEKEELVDTPGNHKALFQKLDFINDHLPEWLVPETKRVKKHLKNLDNGSAFDGEATIENLATGDRRTAILMDETSKMAGAAKIFTSTRDVTKCRIFNSTPNGRFGLGEAFYKRIRNPHTRKIFMHWSEHPEKSEGLYKLIDGRRIPLGPGYDWRDDYDFDQLTFHGENKPRSPWYDEQCKRSDSSQEIAQELDIDFLGSSERFAEEALMALVRQRDVRPPVAEGRLGVAPDDTCEVLGWSNTAGGPFRIWCPFDGQRPPRSQYTVGVDISAGTGGQYTSNSTIFVIDGVSGVQAAEFSANDMPCYLFARFAVGVCKWFHDAYMVPEVNGPNGATFVNVLKDVGYWNVYHQEQQGIYWDVKTKKIGWHQKNKTPLMESMQGAIAQRKLTVRSEMLVRELLEYEWKGGKIVHAGSSVSESESDKGEAHGDMAIAAACAWLGCVDVPAAEPEEQSEPSPTYDCAAKRFEEHAARLAATGQRECRW